MHIIELTKEQRILCYRWFTEDTPHLKRLVEAERFVFHDKDDQRYPHIIHNLDECIYIAECLKHPDHKKLIEFQQEFIGG